MLKMKKIAMPSKNLQYEGKTDENIINFDANIVLKKSSTSVCWKFFSFRGTQEKGPDKNTVFCNLCDFSHSKVSSTTPQISHLRSAHWEVFYSAGGKENNAKTHNDNPTLDSLPLEDEEVNNKVSDKVENVNVKTFLPFDVLGKTPKSLCWDFFFFKGTKENGAVKSRVYCNICSKGSSTYGFPYSSSTTNMTGHLRSHHENQLKKAKNRRLYNEMDDMDEMGGLVEEQQLDDIQEETRNTESNKYLKDNLHAAPVWKFMDDLGSGQSRCKVCERTFKLSSTSTSQLTQHILNSHSETRDALDLRNAIKIRIANKKSMDKTNFIEDMVIPAGSRWQCKVCAKVIKDKVQIDNHVKTHFG